MGNMFARRQGTQADALPVKARSSSDTQPATGNTITGEPKRTGQHGFQQAGGREMRAFFGRHGAQNQIFDSETKDIGVVAYVQRLSWPEFAIAGIGAETGSGPMRKNAGLGMALRLQRLDEIALFHTTDASGATGPIEVFPKVIHGPYGHACNRPPKRAGEVVQ